MRGHLAFYRSTCPTHNDMITAVVLQIKFQPIGAFELEITTRSNLPAVVVGCLFQWLVYMRMCVL